MYEAAFPIWEIFVRIGLDYNTPPAFSAYELQKGNLVLAFRENNKAHRLWKCASQIS